MSTTTIGERVTRRQLFGAMMAAVGALLYSSGKVGATSIGMIAATVALFSNVAGGLLGRSINRDTTASAVVVTTVSMTIGSLRTH